MFQGITLLPLVQRLQVGNPGREEREERSDLALKNQAGQLCKQCLKDEEKKWKTTLPSVLSTTGIGIATKMRAGTLARTKDKATSTIAGHEIYASYAYKVPITLSIPSHSEPTGKDFTTLTHERPACVRRQQRVQALLTVPRSARPRCGGTVVAQTAHRSARQPAHPRALFPLQLPPCAMRPRAPGRWLVSIGRCR